MALTPLHLQPGSGGVRLTNLGVNPSCSQFSFPLESTEHIYLSNPEREIERERDR